MAEMESAWWQSEVIAPAMAAGKRPDEILGADFGDRLSFLAERGIVELYRSGRRRHGRPTSSRP